MSWAWQPLLPAGAQQNGAAAGSHAASGGLAADSAVIAGTATHPHVTSGALAVQSAGIAGTSAHLTLHTVTGALAADSATISGLASRAAAGAHGTTGALSADAATISSAAVHTPIHAATGVLAADAATISGTATHRGIHDTAAALSAQSAAISGVAGLTPQGGGWYLLPGGDGEDKKPRKRNERQQIRELLERLLEGKQAVRIEKAIAPYKMGVVNDIHSIDIHSIDIVKLSRDADAVGGIIAAAQELDDEEVLMLM